MALVIEGTKISEFSERTGPEGRVLTGEGETGLSSHTEATRAARARADGGKTFGFADTPATRKVFESLREGRKAKDEAEGDGAETAAEDTAAEEAPEPTTETKPPAGKARGGKKKETP